MKKAIKMLLFTALIFSFNLFVTACQGNKTPSGAEQGSVSSDDIVHTKEDEISDIFGE